MNVFSPQVHRCTGPQVHTTSYEWMSSVHRSAGPLYFISSRHRVISSIYYMEESVLLGTKPLVDSIRHFIRDPSGVFSVCHLCECRIVQWRHDSRLLLLLNWFLHIIKRTLHVGSKIWIFMMFSRQEQYISLVRCAHSWDIVLATRT